MRQGEMNPGPMTPEARSRDFEDERERMDGDENAGLPSWQDIKSRFVDDPPGAMAAAEDLVRRAVEDKIRRLKDSEADLRDGATGDDASSTESLRARLLRYQAYCESLSGTTAH
jgi:hypothetical protein